MATKTKKPLEWVTRDDLVRDWSGMGFITGSMGALSARPEHRRIILHVTGGEDGFDITRSLCRSIKKDQGLFLFIPTDLPEEVRWYRFCRWCDRIISNEGTSRWVLPRSRNQRVRQS